MIAYILIALSSLFIAFCCGCAAGYSTGYKAAYGEMLPIVKQLEKITDHMVSSKSKNGSDNDGTVRTSEEGDRGTP